MNVSPKHRKNQSAQYASTLPVSKENAHLVRFYCILHELPVHEFVNNLLATELNQFKQKIKEMKK